jgi:hypothetical protein
VDGRVETECRDGRGIGLESIESSEKFAEFGGCDEFPRRWARLRCHGKTKIWLNEANEFSHWHVSPVLLNDKSQPTWLATVTTVSRSPQSNKRRNAENLLKHLTAAYFFPNYRDKLS